MNVRSQTETPGALRQVITVDGRGQLFADNKADDYGGGTAPGAHDLFDASLAACKALTVHWYAKKRNFPLEKVNVVVERDDSREKEGHYGLTVSLEFEGPLTEEQRARLHDVSQRCPIHKLMTEVEVTITTQPLAAAT